MGVTPPKKSEGYAAPTLKTRSWTPAGAHLLPSDLKKDRLQFNPESNGESLLLGGTSMIKSSLVGGTHQTRTSQAGTIFSYYPEKFNLPASEFFLFWGAVFSLGRVTLLAGLGRTRGRKTV